MQKRDVKVFSNAKRLKVPHQWVEVGGRVGQLLVVTPFHLPQFHLGKRRLYLLKGKNVTYLPAFNSVIHNYKVMTDKTLYQKISPTPIHIPMHSPT